MFYGELCRHPVTLAEMSIAHAAAFQHQNNFHGPWFETMNRCETLFQSLFQSYEYLESPIIRLPDEVTIHSVMKIISYINNVFLNAKR
jgi:hypothetical protein